MEVTIISILMNFQVDHLEVVLVTIKITNLPSLQMVGSHSKFKTSYNSC